MFDVDVDASAGEQRNAVRTSSASNVVAMMSLLCTVTLQDGGTGVTSVRAALAVLDLVSHRRDSLEFHWPLS